MKGLRWWMAERMARRLSSSDRDAILGDLIESGTSGGQALRQLVGLFLRRQVAEWNNWRLWVALLGVMAPFAVLLPRVCDLSSIYMWMFVANWRVTDLGNSGFRLVFLEWIGTVIVTYLILFLWSWVCGFVLGSLSGSSALINGMILACVWIAQFPERLHGPDDSNVAVFSHTFYRVTIPLLLQAFLVLIPGLWGMHRGFRLRELRADTALRLTLAIGILTALMEFTNSWWQLGAGWPMRVVLVAAQWPLVYLLVSLFSSRRQGRMATH